MATFPVINPAPPWSNQDIILYHGTIDSFAAAIVAKVEVSLGKPHRDFGAGFYTTTIRDQAESWARQIAVTKAGTSPAMIELTVSRDALAGLQALGFIVGDRHAKDYWSFVHYCRNGALDHGRTGSQRSYDIVYGPVAGDWRQWMSFANTDQISFHTPAAEAVLNSSERTIIIL